MSERSPFTIWINAVAAVLAGLALVLLPFGFRLNPWLQAVYLAVAIIHFAGIASGMIE